MVSNFVIRLVGLIAVDALSPEQGGPACVERSDATLADVLLLLAGANHPARDESRPQESSLLPVCGANARPADAERLESRSASYWSAPPRLPADLRSLTAELERAVAQARRRIATC